MKHKITLSVNYNYWWKSQETANLKQPIKIYENYKKNLSQRMGERVASQGKTGVL